MLALMGQSALLSERCDSSYTIGKRNVSFPHLGKTSKTISGALRACRRYHDILGTRVGPLRLIAFVITNAREVAGDSISFSVIQKGRD